jgi:hypothetical protein
MNQENVMIPLTEIAFVPGRIINGSISMSDGHQKNKERNHTTIAGNKLGSTSTEHSCDENASRTESVHDDVREPESPHCDFHSESFDVFEIREYLDAQGNTTDQEVVNLTRQMEDIEKKVAASEASVGSSSNCNASAERSSSTDQGLGFPASTPVATSSADDFDEEVRGLVTCNSENALAALEKLELDEAEWEAVERIKKRERELQEKALPAASPGGWKKGFLSPSGPADHRPPSSSPSIPAPSSSAAEALNFVHESESSSRRNGDAVSASSGVAAENSVASKATSVRKTNGSSDSSSSGTGASPSAGPGVNRKPAFTGTVMERFP